VIRFATEEDLPVLVEMVRKFYNATPYSALVFDEKKTTEVIRNLINESNNISIVLVADDLDIRGTIIASVTEPLCSSEKISTELVWWVDEAYRGRISIELLDAYEYWQKKVGCSAVSMASIQGGSNLDKFYKRRGYIPSEVTYYKVN
jgi:hypothetical protein